MFTETDIVQRTDGNEDIYYITKITKGGDVYGQYLRPDEDKKDEIHLLKGSFKHVTRVVGEYYKIISDIPKEPEIFNL